MWTSLPSPGTNPSSGSSGGSGQEAVRIYPNPTTGEVFLPVPGEVLVRVFDNVGQLQMEKTVSDNRLNLAQLQPGIYRLQLFHDGRMLTTQHVVLAKP